MPSPKKAAAKKAAPKATPKKMPSRAKTTKARVDFKIHAPDAQQVYLAGSFNDWDAGSKALRRGKDDLWRSWTNLPTGAHEYRYVIDGEWVEDPAVEARQPNPFGSHNSVITV